MITTDQQELLADIFENSTRPEKMSIHLNEDSRTVTIIYENLDREWFKELVIAAQEVKS